MPDTYKFEIDVDSSRNIYDLNICFNSLQELISFLSQTFANKNESVYVKNPVSQDFVAFSNYDSATPVRKKPVRSEDILKTPMTVQSLKDDQEMMAKKVNTISTDVSSPVTSKYSNFSELKH
jgi:hypothetical protein